MHEVDTALIRATHYHGRTPAISAAPTSTPGRIWVPAVDGVIRVLDSTNGSEIWRFDLGIPITSSLAVAGDIVYVATFDGVIHALTSPE